MSAESLRKTLSELPECELRRCALRALDLWSEPDPLPSRLRDIDAAVFRAFGLRDLPAEVIERDYEGALALLERVGELQGRLRRGLFERFGLRCIVGAVGEPYDERSPRYVAAMARPTGNPELDWHVADTAVCGYEWDGQPAVLLPARVDVYRYDATAGDDAADGLTVEPLFTPVMPSPSAKPIPVGGEAVAGVTDREVEAPADVTITLPDATQVRLRGPVHLRIEGATP